MRIGLVVPGGVDRSGVDRVIPALLHFLTRLARRHEVHVFALSQEKEPCVYALGGFEVVNLGLSGRGTRLRALRFFAAELRRRGPFDVLHAFWADTPGLLATLAGRALGVPTVVSLAGGELAAIPEIGYGGALRFRSRSVARATLFLASAVTAASEPVAALAAARAASAELVPLGVEVDTALTVAPVRQAPPFRLVSIGHLNAVKDSATLLRAFRRAREGESRLHLDVVGVDTLDGAAQRLVKELGLDRHVTFHGLLRHGETMSLLSSADLLLVSSRHEAGPVAALEAWARGVPVVGTAVGHLADGAPERCVAVPVGDAEALGTAALALLADAPWRERIARAAQDWARRHDADATCRAFEAIYTRLASHRATRSR